MDLVSAPIEDQLAAFKQMVMTNSVVATVIEWMPRLEVPGCYLAAGALYQTVWNCLCGRDPRGGIKDYDINYFDAVDLSWAAEDAVIRRGAELFGDLDATVEIRNEARVHLWYEEKFGLQCPPYSSTEDAIATFPSTSSAFGIRPRDGALDVYAPYGFTDLFALRTRPNPVLAPRHVYESKTACWRQHWPELEVIPWLSNSPGCS
jgi:hypothetical protein